MELNRRSRNLLRIIKGRARSLQRQALRVSAGISARLRNDPRRISVAIPTFERSSPAAACLDRLIEDERIAEIVVRDDASTPDLFARLRDGLERRSAKLRLTRSERNLGPLANKWRAIADCTNDWVVLLDSDNAIDSAYLDVLFGIDPWDPDVIYCPEFARPHFDFRQWGGEVIDLAGAQRLLSGDAPKFATTLLNTGNYFVSRARYLGRLEPALDTVREVPDVLVANYAWLRAGGRLNVVKGLAYEHVVHDGSFSKAHNDRCKDAAREIRRCLANRSDLPEALKSPQRRR